MSDEMLSRAFGPRDTETRRAVGKYREVFRAEAGSEKKCFLCGHKFLEVHSHYVPQRTGKPASYFCVGPNAGCVWCLDKKLGCPVRRRAYCQAIETLKLHQVICEITSQAFDENMAIRDGSVDLFGMTARLKRKSKEANSRVQIFVSRDYLSSQQRLALCEFDLMAALKKVYRIPPFLIDKPAEGDDQDAYLDLSSLEPLPEEA